MAAMTPPSSPLRRGFTLIELLVVIAAISILVGILLPALSHARRCAVMTGELSAARQMMAGYLMYAHDHNGSVMPGFPSRAMIRQGAISARDHRGSKIENELVVQRYPWRLLPYLEYTTKGMYRDNQLVDSLLAEGRTDEFIYVVSSAPRMGLNHEFVGGSDARGKPFSTSTHIINRNRAWGRFYVRRADEARRPSDLIVFASSSGATAVAGGVTVDGHFAIDPPSFDRPLWRAGMITEQTSPTEAGNVSFRHMGRAAAVMLDGHAKTLNGAEMRDMRRWSPQATEADWKLVTNP